MAAFVDTEVMEEGPFGPRPVSYLASGGFTAWELPDGSVAYRWPESRVIVAYYFAEQGVDGWSITRSEGPSC